MSGYWTSCMRMSFWWLCVFVVVELLAAFGYAQIVPVHPECQQPFKSGEIKYDYPLAEVSWTFAAPTTVTSLTLGGLDFIGYGELVVFKYMKQKQDQVKNYAFQNKFIPDISKNLCDISYIALDQPIPVVWFQVVYEVDKSQEKNIEKCGDLHAILFGCKENVTVSAKEYPAMKSCSIPNKPILSNANQLIIRGGSKFVLFSEPKAWCKKRSSITKVQMMIDLKERFLLTSLKVGNYSNLTSEFTIDYSDDTRIWASSSGNQDIRPELYISKEMTIHPPLIARYVKITMKAINGVSCLKLQIYGCKAILFSQDDKKSPRNLVALPIIIAVVVFILVVIIAVYVCKKRRTRSRGDVPKQLEEDKKLINTYTTAGAMQIPQSQQPDYTSISTENVYESFASTKGAVAPACVLGKSSESKNSDNYYTNMDENNSPISRDTSLLYDDVILRNPGKVKAPGLNQDNIYESPSIENEYLTPVQTQDEHYEPLDQMESDRKNLEYADLQNDEFSV